MLSWSDRQASIVTVSGRFGGGTVERDLPPNMREIGESIELAYSRPSYVSNIKFSIDKRNNWHTVKLRFPISVWPD
jgi:hypothetical protein